MPVAPKSIVGVVVSAGKMQRAVKVRVAGQVFNSFLKKQFGNHRDYLVSDPNDSIRLGDVIRIEDAGRQISRRIRHVISEIVAPWGPAIDERPPVLSADKRHAIWMKNYKAKVKRRQEEKSAQANRDLKSVPKIEKKEGSREPRRARRAKVETHDDKVEGMVEGTMVAS